MKRKIVAVAALAATLLGAAACGSNDDDSPTTSASGPVDGKGKTLKAVSYTHLTLPTNREV